LLVSDLEVDLVDNQLLQKKLEEKTAAPLQPKVEAQSKPNDQEGKI